MEEFKCAGCLVIPQRCGLYHVMPLEEFTPGWIPAHIGVEGDAVSLNGLRPWKLKWRRLQADPVVVPHPTHTHERHLAWVYEIETSDKRVTFAAGELSNGVWGFYLPSNEGATHGAA